MGDNPISGHTAGTNDGLRDGDHIISPSLTNIYEGLHGNGVLNPYDTAYGSPTGDRITPANLPGAISSSVAHQVIIKACSVILDGVPYNIDNGSGGDVTINLTSGGDKLTGTSTTVLTSGKECLFAIIATSEGAKFVQSNVVTTAPGVYASLAGSIADSYLKMGGVSSAQNKQTIVLATIRAVFNGSAAAANDLKLTLSEINDKRVFIRPSPFYLSPVTDGNVGSTSHLNTHTALEQIHGSGEHGDFGANGVLWMSYNEDDGLPNLYFSAKDGSNRHTHLLGPNRIKTITGISTPQTFDFDEAQVFECNAGGAINLNPAGTFPPGHTVIVSVPSGSAVTFDQGGLGAALTAGDAALFVYNGTAWKKVMVSATSTTNASGIAGLVQFSDGAGNHSSDAKLFWTTGTSTLTVTGKLTITGLIGSGGLQITPVAANPGVTAANTLWMDSGASNALKHGANTVLNSASSVADLSDVTGVGSGIIISGAERTKLTNIETAADVTDATNVNAAITGHAYTGATLAANDKVLIQDTDDGNAVKTVTASSIAALGGGGGGGSSISDADSDTKIDVETSSDADTISMHTDGTERVLIDTNVNLGVDVDLTFEGSTAVGNFETTLTVTNPTADRTITLPNATGTVALTSGVPSIAGLVDAAGAVAAVQANSTITLATTATFRASRSVVLPVPVATLNLDRVGQAGVIVLCPGGQTVNLPDPGAAMDGDTYVIINVNAPSTGAITIDRSGFGGQNLNGAATNGSLPAHEAVTLIYTGLGTGWYGIGL